MIHSALCCVVLCCVVLWFSCHTEKDRDWLQIVSFPPSATPGGASRAQSLGRWSGNSAFWPKRPIVAEGDRVLFRFTSDSFHSRWGYRCLVTGYKLSTRAPAVPGVAPPPLTPVPTAAVTGAAADGKPSPSPSAAAAAATATELASAKAGALVVRSSAFVSFALVFGTSK